MITFSNTCELDQLAALLLSKYINRTCCPTTNNNTITINAGQGILIPNTNTQFIRNNPVYDVYHADTSAVADLVTADANVIETMTFDTFGHVQSITTRELDITDIVPPSNGLVSGGQVTWTGIGYVYTIDAAVYRINSITYNSPAITVTLDPADTTFNRIDSFIVDTTGNATVLTGTPSDNPAPAPLDIATQLQLNFALVVANTVEPLQDFCIYTDGIEWTINTIGGFAGLSVVSPCFGTKSIEATALTDGDYILLTSGSDTIVPKAYQTLTLILKSKGSLNSNQILLQWENASVPVGLALPIVNGSYGFNSANTTICQAINIPINDFGGLTFGSFVDSLRISGVVVSGTLGFFIDNICLTTEVIGAVPLNLYTFSNGLILKPGNMVEFGTNPLLHNTTLETNAFVQTFSGATIYDYSYQFVARQSFENGTGLVSFKHNGSLDPLAADFVNNVRLGINYTGNIYNSFVDLNGYFGSDDIGYWMGVNGQGHGSFGIYTDDVNSKTGGIFWHTLDSNSTDMVTVFGKQPTTANSAISIQPGQTGFLDYKIATFKTTKQWQGFGYGVGTFVDPSPAYRAAWDISGNLVEQVIDCPVGVVSGGMITWVSDLIFEIEPTVYYINCVRYQILVPTQITLNPADVTDPRIDILALDETGLIKVTGVAAPDPESPQTDGDDIFLTHVLINAGATVPANVTSEVIYDENIEWTHTTTNLTANFNSATNVVHLTKDIDVSTFVSAGYIEFTSLTGTFDLSTWAALRLYYRNKTSGSPRLTFQWYQGTTAKTQAVVYNPTNNTAASQSIVIPISSFSFLTNSTVDRLRIAFGPLIIGAYIDWIQLQQGLVIAGGATTVITADNGLIMSTATNVQLGGLVGSPATLLHDSYITNGLFSLNLSSSTLAGASLLNLAITSTAATGGTQKGLNISLSGNNANIAETTYGIFVTNNHGGTVPNNYGIWSTVSGAGGIIGVHGGASGGGTGVEGISISGTGVDGSSTSGTGGNFSSLSGVPVKTFVNPTSTNTIVTSLEILRVAGNFPTNTPANGIGTSIDFKIADSLGSGALSNQIISKWTTATSATRTSQLDITGVGSTATATIMSAHGSGSVDIGDAGNVSTSIRLKVNATGSSGQIGILSLSNAAAAIVGTATGNAVGGAFNTSSTGTNDITDIVSVTRTSTGTAAAGIGARIQYSVQADDGGTYPSNGLISKWTVATLATRTSQLDITGVNSAATAATIMSAHGSGVVGIGRFSSFGATRLDIVDNTLGGANAVNISSTSTAAASNLQKLLNIELSGANATASQTTWGIYSANTHTNSLFNYGISGYATGGSVNYGVKGEAVGSSGYGVYGKGGGGANGGVLAESDGGLAALVVRATGGAFGIDSDAVNQLGFIIGGSYTSGATEELVGYFYRNTLVTAGDGIAANISISIETSDNGGIASHQFISQLTTASYFTSTSKMTLKGLFGGTVVNNMVWNGDGSVDLRPITAAAASAITPSEAKLVFVSDTDGTFTSIGLWCYENGTWSKK